MKTLERFNSPHVCDILFSMREPSAASNGLSSPAHHHGYLQPLLHCDIVAVDHASQESISSRNSMPLRQHAATQQETQLERRGRAREFFALSRVYNKMNVRAAITVLLSALVTGCATVEAFDEPYTLFEGGSRSTVRKEFPVIISTVDGQTLRDPRRSVAIKPGRHQLDVHFTTLTGPDWKHWATVEIVAEPCTRYRIVARYDNLVHVEWVPVIYPEPIGECVARFGQTTPRAA